MQMSGDATLSPWESGISGFRPAGASNLQLASTFQLKGKQRCLDARAPQLLVAGDTSALPQGRNPAATLLTPHGQVALQPPHLAPQSKSLLALGTGWHMLPLRPLRVCMSNPEGNKVRDTGKLDSSLCSTLG